MGRLMLGINYDWMREQMEVDDTGRTIKMNKWQWSVCMSIEGRVTDAK